MPEKTPRRSPSPFESGLSLFLLYVLLYGGFIFGCVFKPDVMAHRVLNTVTVAVAYGMLLIITAAILALAYLQRMKK